MIFQIILTIALICVIIAFIIHNNEKNREHKNSLLEQKIYYDNLLYMRACEEENYRRQISNNMHNTIPDGELILINKFKELFQSNVFKDFTVYNQLVINFDGNINRIDFFIVSAKGLFVIESKCWRGVTYFYSKNYPDIFTATEFKSFGVGSSLDIRAINVKEHADEKGKLMISSYKNPIAQARKYSLALTKVLPINLSTKIKNVVIMNRLKDFAAFYDDKPLEKKYLDEYSSLITDENIKSYFDVIPDVHYDTQEIVKYIDNNLWHHFKMDINNYAQAPFNLI